MRDIEDYLEREIYDIVDKRKFDSNAIKNKRNLNANAYNMSSRPHNRDYRNNHEVDNRYGQSNRYEKSEEYLPFNKEEIRPIIRDAITPSRVESLVMETFAPRIESWLDENLERIVHRVIKKYVAKKNLENEMDDREDINDRGYQRRPERNYYR